MDLKNNEAIRVKDIPERYQALDHYHPAENEIAREATIITKTLLKSRQVEEAALLKAVNSVIKFIRIDFFEVPFIWAHRRDYFDGILNLNDIWAILDYDTKFTQVELKKKSLLQLIVQISSVDSSIQENESQYGSLPHT